MKKATARRDGVRVAVLGALLGGVAALFLGRLVANLLYETAPYDPAVIGVAALGLLATAVAASFVPAWRAGRVDPVVALRAG